LALSNVISKGILDQAYPARPISEASRLQRTALRCRAPSSPFSSSSGPCWIWNYGWNFWIGTDFNAAIL